MTDSNARYDSRAVIVAQVLLRDGPVYMRKRFEVHRWFEGLIHAGAHAHIQQAKCNKLMAIRNEAAA